MVTSALLITLLTVAVNVLLATYRWLGHGIIPALLRPLPETILVVVAIGCVAALRTGWRRRAAAVVAGIIAGLLLGVSIAEAGVRYIFARPFTPSTDLGMVRGLLWLLFGDIGELAGQLQPVVVVALFLLFFGLGIAIVGAAGGAVGRVARAAGDGRHLRRIAAPIAVVVLVTAPWTLAPTGQRALIDQAVLSWWEAAPADFTVGAALAGSPGDGVVGARGADDGGADGMGAAYRLPGFLDRDVYLIAVEAYGYATYSRPDLYAALAPARARLDAALRRAGFDVRSTLVRSPVAGGFSWLAEATLLTGQWIDTQERFEQLYGAGLPTLTGLFHDAGYYTLSVRPGTVHGAWPEGWDLYRFNEWMTPFDGSFTYVGPWFSYVPITDQFAMWAGMQRVAELRVPRGEADGRPLLAHFQLVSSHTPFNRIPPMIESWDDLGDGSVYLARAAEILTFDNTWTGGTELDEGYITAITYTLDVLTRWVDELVDAERNPIIIIFGDHQAQRPIREATAHLSVPVHIASRDREVLAQFALAGWDRGLTPTASPPHPDMSTLFPLLARFAATDSDTARRLEATIDTLTR